MKNKILTIILSVALVISVGVNIYLINDVNNSKETIDAISNQLEESNEQIADLEGRLEAIQEQLSFSNEQIVTMEDAFAENEGGIDLDEVEIAPDKAGEEQDNHDDSEYDIMLPMLPAGEVRVEVTTDQPETEHDSSEYDIMLPMMPPGEVRIELPAEYLEQ